MARIPEDEINRIKTDIPLQALVESRGIELKRHGQHDWVGCCPFHNDKTPSLIITPSKNLFHCLGCGAAGSVIDWVMKTQSLNFRDAVESLQDKPSSFTAPSHPASAALAHPCTSAAKPSAKVSKTKSLNRNASDQALLNQVIDYYHETLKQNPDAQTYLETRGLKNSEVIDHFKLGFSNRSLAKSLPEKSSKAGGEIRTQLQTIGLLRKSGHEHFSGSLIIPVINDHQVKEVYGRKINHSLRKGTAYHSYLPGPHQGVFNIEALCASKTMILCESLIDALSFWVNGFRNVTTSYGVNGFTDELLNTFKQHGTQTIYIAYDRDSAGEKAAADLAAKLEKENIDCYRVQFPKGMDANSYSVKMQPAKKALALVINKAEYMGEGEPLHQQTSEPETEDQLTSFAAPSHPATVALAHPCTSVADPKGDVLVETKDNDIHITIGERVYRIRGLLTQSHEQLKINLMIKNNESLHIDKLDLYSAKQRQVFINQASVELALKEGIIKKDLGKVLLKLEELQHQQQQETQIDETKTLSPQAQREALNLLTDKNLLHRILDDFNRAGVIGEETNKLVGYLAGVSRKLNKPLAVMIQSSSAAGKSALMDAILDMMPEEEKTQYSAMTGQSLFYMGETNLKHKILAITEEEGAHNASYALKLLQSEGEVTIASTGKDASTGQLVTQEYKVEGPVMLFMTTTAIDIDEELLNRCLVLSVNETRSQTRAIHAQQRQRRTLQGLVAQQKKKDILEQHQNAQRLLKSLSVINPYADQLTFLDAKTRTRRDHEKYLTLIDSIALLHQYQRKVKTIDVNGKAVDYIEVNINDIEAANQLAHEVLGRTLDELPPQTRKLLKRIQAMVKDACAEQSVDQCDYRFSRKDIRYYTDWGNTQLKVHCSRLEDMEYLLVHRGGRGQSFEYELLYDADKTQLDQTHLMGLIEVKQLKKHHYDVKKSGVDADGSGSSRPQVGGRSEAQKTLIDSAVTDDSGSGRVKRKNGQAYKNKVDTSYRQTVLPQAAKN